MPWFWDLVNMSVQVPLSLPQVENLLTQPFSQCPHRDLLGLNLHAWLLEPLAYKCKVSLMKWQRELRLLRDSQPELSDSKWTIFIKWCDSNKMDFRSPSLSQIAKFLLYLFKEKHLQPSTIDGYMTAIADKIGSDKINIGKDENLTRLLDSFHRDKPKGLRGVPSWSLSLALHQLTRPPFEPLRKASLKHLTFKTVLLWVLAKE